MKEDATTIYRVKFSGSTMSTQGTRTQLRAMRQNAGGDRVAILQDELKTCPHGTFVTCEYCRSAGDKTLSQDTLGFLNNIKREWDQTDTRVSIMHHFEVTMQRLLDSSGLQLKAMLDKLAHDGLVRNGLATEGVVDELKQYPIMWDIRRRTFEDGDETSYTLLVNDIPFGTLYHTVRVQVDIIRGYQTPFWNTTIVRVDR